MQDDSDNGGTANDTSQVTAYIYKYALTQGIMEVRGEIEHDGKYIWCTLPGGVTKNMYREYALTRDEAVKSAERLRDRKVASIKKQLKKLEALKF